MEPRSTLSEISPTLGPRDNHIIEYDIAKYISGLRPGVVNVAAPVEGLYQFGLTDLLQHRSHPPVLVDFHGFVLEAAVSEFAEFQLLRIVLLQREWFWIARK